MTAETTMRNIRIADWMNTGKYKDSEYWQLPERVTQLLKAGLVPKSSPEMLLYDCSYDWIFCVIERIEGLGFIVTIQDNSCHISPKEDRPFEPIETTADLKILAMHEACAILIERMDHE